MISLAIDDDGHVARSGPRQHRFLGAWLWCLAVGGALVALLLMLTAPLLLVLWVPAMGIYLYDAWWAHRATLPVVGIGTGSVEVGGDGLVIDHPVLTVPLHLGWADIRSFALEPAVPWSNWRYRTHRLFPVHRRPGIGHPLDEPRTFLDAWSSDHGALEVPLVSIDAGRLLPNVVLLFAEPRELEVAAPPWAGDRGWIPGRQAGGRSMRGATVMLQRTIRRLRTPGIYLRILDPTPLRDALIAHGIREGLDCTDWVFATGSEHQGLD